MKSALVAMMMALGVLQGTLAATIASPVGKVISMISDLQAKVIGEGLVAQKQYAEFAEWCEDRSSTLGFDIKTGK